MISNISIRIAGEGGEGVISTGELLTLAYARTRHDVYTFRTYPAEIKGGPAMFQVRCGDHPVLSQGTVMDVLLAFNDEAIQLHLKDLGPQGVLVYDSAVMEEADGKLKQGQVAYAVPLTTIAIEGVGLKRAKNMVGLAVLGALTGLPIDAVKGFVQDKFGKKGQDVLDKNLKAVEEGYKWVLKHNIDRDLAVSSSVRKEQKVVMSGNEAISAGAILAGCRYYAGYPITPASDILSFMEHELPRFGGVAVQTEDEIAALISCIGASYSGVKAMTATSGPGLSLMVEALGLSSMTETPVVIIDAQRAGPSTGMPTKTEQGDLLHAVFAGHGEAPRVVLAPCNVKDCFYGIVKAFNIAEKYQIPVIMLSDQSLSHRTQTFTKPKTTNMEIVNRLRAKKNGSGFERYADTENGVSPTSVPGDDGLMYAATGLEHDATGAPSFTPATHYRMMAKRHRKLQYIAKEKGFTRRFGDEHAELGIISWGCTEGPIEEAIHEANRAGLEVAALQLKMIHPLPDEEIQSFLSSVKQVLIPELNYTGQLWQLLQARYLRPMIRLNKCAGVPFTAGEILKKIEEVYHHA